MNFRSDSCVPSAHFPSYYCYRNQQQNRCHLPRFWPEGHRISVLLCVQHFSNCVGEMMLKRRPIVDRDGIPLGSSIYFFNHFWLTSMSSHHLISFHSLQPDITAVTTMKIMSRSLCRTFPCSRRSSITSKHLKKCPSYIIHFSIYVILYLIIQYLNLNCNKKSVWNPLFSKVSDTFSISPIITK